MKQDANPHFVYLVKCEGSHYYKIGLSIDPLARLASLQTACPFRLLLLQTCGFPDYEPARQAERQAHNALAKHRVHNEWFELTDADVVTLRREMALTE